MIAVAIAAYLVVVLAAYLVDGTNLAPTIFTGWALRSY